ncbi:hypothetical protein C427_1067 [Paraglaciecola psychrophila 170]|uniref:Uncharacterized protein n=1 Tax=Paraglaciecola psychrophila 170 TaxID=1129794 RepID=K7ADZ1_9ALTE|nr:hypothetical protein C427_1067 [Paraglaciecola psychrophila 170]GAC38853.1 hypothetical protein GPSY_3242 [Paraglaciecola psychrophila 170]
MIKRLKQNTIFALIVVRQSMPSSYFVVQTPYSLSLSYAFTIYYH